MAKNDRLLLDGIIDDRVHLKLPSEKRDEAFEYLALEQITKDDDFSTDEILYGWIDGRQDGGIDGFFVLVNGHMLQDPESFTWPRTNSELKVVFVTCKHHDTFKQATLDAMIATLTEILDFSLEDTQLTGAYSPLLLKMRNNLKYAYRKMSPRLSHFKVEIFYASRGDTRELGEEVEARGRQVEAIVKNSFGSCSAKFKFIGSTELVELHRLMPNYTLELPFVEALAKGERYVVLVRLSDYYEFISNDGKLRRYLFESNVRDFMGMNRVNEDIRSTLSAEDSPDFWWLNNGVTILATSAAITGKSIQANDVQIVNGLQTTESIFRHFESRTEVSDDRCVLVKVIVTKDESIRDAIIRATNNQTDVELASLHATDKIQRDIEDTMLRHGLYYERRKNFYANQGHATAELVTPLYAAAGYMALILKAPHQAASLRSKFMRTATTYERVFDENVTLEVWPKIVQVLRRVDNQLEHLRPIGKGADRFLKGWRYITAFILLSQHFRRFNFSANDVAKLDLSVITPAEIERVWLQLRAITPSETRGAWTSLRAVLRACEASVRTHDVANLMSLHKTAFEPSPTAESGNHTPSPISQPSSELIARVKAALPPQPWKPGLHRRIASEVGCNLPAYFAAVAQLIENGDFHRQRDGVVYDRDGNVICFDPERVDPDTLELR